MPRVYLAGPDVFRPDAVAQGARLKALCAAHGLEGVYPLDGAGPDDGAEAIRARCQAGIDRVDGMVANISPFRGVHMDPGTAWEIGYAEARGLPVFLWSGDPRPLAERTGTPGADGHRDEDGHLVEDFGQPENLMIVPPGVTVWASPDEAVAEAARQLARLTKARQLWRGIGVKILIALLVSIVARIAVGRLVGW